MVDVHTQLKIILNEVHLEADMFDDVILIIVVRVMPHDDEADELDDVVIIHVDTENV